MSDFWLPEDVVPREVRWGAIDSTAIFGSDTSGAIRSSEIVCGSALAPILLWPPLKNESGSARRRSRLIAILNRLRGQANRLWSTIPGYTQQGSFPAPELLGNNSFAAGITGWATSVVETSISVQDRMLRIQRNAGITGGVVHNVSAVSLVQYAPYCLRAMLYGGRGVIDQDIRLGSTAGAADYARSTVGSSALGLITTQGTPFGTSGFFGVADTVITNPGKRAGDYMECPFVSLARCALVDNAPNGLLHSNDFTNVAWGKVGSAATADVTSGSDGLVTMDRLSEDTSTGTHRVQQAVTKAAVAEDWTGRVEFKANSRTEAQIQIGAASANFANFAVNLSTGAVIAAATGVGAVTNARGTVTNLGGNIYEVALTARIPSSITTGNTLIAYIRNGSTSYTGDGASNLFIGRASYAATAHPMRYAETTTAAVASGTLQSGVNLHARGLLVSSSGLLLANDWIQFGREAHLVVARWDSDAAGRGFLQLARPMRTPPADGAAIVINNPMMKLLQAQNILNWTDRPAAISDLEVEFLEATAG